ncbi:hypothetical protein [Prevotella pectinovora]|uniref:hypothetical protein n=1 Tax=Prevotella pectinovora TaxID=1602169 RepID=UPI003079E293
MAAGVGQSRAAVKEGSDTIVSPRRWDGIAKVARGGRRMKFCIVFLSEPESCQQAW